MKLAFCVFKYFPFGGLERNCMRMAEVAVSRGHTVDLYCIDWAGERPGKVSVIQVSARGWTNHGRARSFAHKMREILNAASYDVVVGFNRMPGLDLFYAADICYEEDVQNRHGWFYRLLPRYRLYAEFEKAVYSTTSKTQILSIVEAEKVFCQQHYQTPDDRFHDVPPGIHPDRKALPHKKAIRSEVRALLSMPENDFLILSVGSDFARKGVDRTLTAIASLPADIKHKTHLWVIGQDDPKQYQQLAKQLGIGSRVHFLGARKDIPRLLAAGDVLLHPARKEATGGALLEAIVAGLPVLATAVCGFAFHIKKAQAGKVIPTPFEQAQLDRLLLEMLTSPDRPLWEANAIAYGQTEDLYSRALRTIEIIEKIAKGKQS